MKQRNNSAERKISRKSVSGLLRVSEAAARVGVSPSTLRLWEKHNLLQPERTESGQRLYDVEIVEKIRDIMRMRSVQGLNIQAIRQVLGQTRTEAPPQSGVLGTRLRNLRTAQGLSLREVAEKTGLAYSFISALERTSKGASMTSIKKLARCYKTTVTALFDENLNQTNEIVVRANQGGLVPVLGPSVSIEQLGNNMNVLDCQKWKLTPGASSDGPYTHEGEEFIFVLQGTFMIWVEGDGECVLHTGDSISFSSMRPHTWFNPGQTDAVVIWINTPRTF